MKFTDLLWQSAEDIYIDTLSHPFNVELAAGTLSMDRFRYYVQQDELYIKDYARALALLAAKAPNSHARDYLLQYATEGVTIERQLHEFFFKRYDIKEADDQEPACFSYTRFLLSTAVLEPFEVGLAGVLPCFWVYRQVGHGIADSSVQNNPFRAWIDGYTDEAYDKIVDRMIEVTEDAAELTTEVVRRQMMKAFGQSTDLEWAFWDAAYRLQRWPHLRHEIV